MKKMYGTPAMCRLAETQLSSGVQADREFQSSFRWIQRDRSDILIWYFDRHG
jgi:hypothetical protein